MCRKVYTYFHIYSLDMYHMHLHKDDTLYIINYNPIHFINKIKTSQSQTVQHIHNRVHEGAFMEVILIEHFYSYLSQAMICMLR